MSTRKIKTLRRKEWKREHTNWIDDFYGPLASLRASRIMTETDGQLNWAKRSRR